MNFANLWPSQINGFFFSFSETAPICEGKWEYFSAVIYGLLAFPTELY